MASGGSRSVESDSESIVVMREGMNLMWVVLACLMSMGQSVSRPA